MNTSRRELLRIGLSSAAVVSMASTMPAFLADFAHAQPTTNPAAPRENILVVLQLSGGNDGLNTLVPIGNDAYVKLRPKIAIKDRIHKLTDSFGLNPGMTPMKELFDNAQLAVIQGCGYPQPSRSHFRSMEIWHTANPKQSEACGWLGHYLDHFLRGTDSPVKAVNIGSELPQALVAESAPVPSIQTLEDFRIRTDPATPFDAKLEEQIIRDLNAVKESTPALAFLSRQATNAIISMDQIRKLAAGYKPDAQYPYGGLGNDLKLIAQLIHANMGTRLFYLQVGGFDTHANQVAGHERLLNNVASALAAFHKDLAAKGLNDKVLVMSFSEFGRRVADNNSAGTDHGAAGPMFLSGGRVKPGLHGTPPSLADLDDGDLKYTTDFRRVYAAVLENWMGVDSSKVLKNRFEPLACIAGMKDVAAPRPLGPNNAAPENPADQPAMDPNMMLRPG